MIDFQKLVYDTIEAQSERHSHTEIDVNTFHPSQMAMCKRQMLLSKLGVVDHNPETKGIFLMGTLMHKHLEEYVEEVADFEVEVEKEVSHTFKTKTSLPDIRIVGHCDLYIPFLDLVVDYKSQTGWYYFDPHSNNILDKETHLNQLNIYMDALDANNGKLVYLDKGKFEPRQYPEEDNTYINYEPDRVNEVVTKTEEVVEELQENGIPQSLEEVPYGKCGCFVCNQESKNTLEFAHIAEMQ